MSSRRMAFREVRSAALQLESDIANGPILPFVTPEEIRGHLLARYDFAKALPLEDVVADVEQMLRKWQVHVTHPRYFGLYNPSVTVASVVGDLLAAMYNPQLAAWRTSPAANEISATRCPGLPASLACRQVQSRISLVVEGKQISRQ